MAKALDRPKALLTPNPKASLRDQVKEVLRFHHYALRTEKAYWQWIRRYLAFHRSADHNDAEAYSYRGLMRAGQRDLDGAD